MIVGDTQGTIYILHFEARYRHAGHYLGWTASDTADARVAEHLRGSGSPLVATALAAGCKVELVRTFSGTPNDERRLKRGGATTRHCPKCRAEYNQRARVRMRARRSGKTADVIRLKNFTTLADGLYCLVCKKLIVRWEPLFGHGVTALDALVAEDHAQTHALTGAT